MTRTNAKGTPVVASARDLGRQFEDNDVEIAAHDGATATVLPDGRALWMFGDTALGEWRGYETLDWRGMLSNSACIVPPQDVSNGIKDFEYLKNDDGSLAEPIALDKALDPPNGRVWPGHGFCVGDTVYIYTLHARLHPAESPLHGITSAGMGIARANVNDLKFERLLDDKGDPCLWHGETGPTWGLFTLLEDGYLYVFAAYYQPGGAVTPGRGGIHVARTRPEALTDPSSYEYLVVAPDLENPDRDPVWADEFAPSAVLFEDAPSEMSVTFNPYLKKYVAIQMFRVDNQVGIRTAPSIVGPWSELEVFYRPERVAEINRFYAAKEHPELARDGGRIIYVTYVDTIRAMPHLLEVTLA